MSEIFKVSVHSLITSQKGRGMKNEERKIAMYLCQRVGDYRLRDIADHFGLSHYGGASSAIYQAKQLLSKDKKRMKIFNSIINRFDP